MLLNIISILSSLIALIISIISLFHNVNISYPRIKIKKLKQPRGNEKNIFLLAYSKSTKTLFLFAKFNAINSSPIAGSIHNCEITCKHGPNLPALTKEDIEVLPNDIKDIYQKYNPDSVLFDTSYTVSPLSATQIVMAFKLNSNFLASNLRYKLTATYYGGSKHNIKLTVPLNFYHFADVYDYEQIYAELTKQERLAFAKFYTQRKLENKKVITMTKKIINPRSQEDKD